MNRRRTIHFSIACQQHILSLEVFIGSVIPQDETPTNMHVNERLLLSCMYMVECEGRSRIHIAMLSHINVNVRCYTLQLQGLDDCLVTAWSGMWSLNLGLF